MKLKTFGGCVIQGGRQFRVVVATTSQAKAAKAAGVSVGYVRDYWSQTSNPKEIELAESEPGRVFEVKL